MVIKWYYTYVYLLSLKNFSLRSESFITFKKAHTSQSNFQPKVSLATCLPSIHFDNISASPHLLHSFCLPDLSVLCRFWSSPFALSLSYCTNSQPLPCEVTQLSHQKLVEKAIILLSKRIRRLQLVTITFSSSKTATATWCLSH